MAKQPYTPPQWQISAFNCSRCGAYAQQRWEELYRQHSAAFFAMPDFGLSKCERCKGELIWYKETIIVPDVSAAPRANDDLDPDIKRDYAEAASIAAKSPRGAAALLRLCIQKLCKQLGQTGRDLNNDIGNLVRNGLDVRVQRALDTVRVIGNEAVHPGEIDLRDDPDTAGYLFTLVNAIANELITQPILRDELYSALPTKKLEAIKQRDKGSAGED